MKRMFITLMVIFLTGCVPKMEASINFPKVDGITLVNNEAGDNVEIIAIINSNMDKHYDGRIINKLSVLTDGPYAYHRLIDHLIDHKYLAYDLTDGRFIDHLSNGKFVRCSGATETAYVSAITRARNLGATKAGDIRIYGKNYPIGFLWWGCYRSVTIEAYRPLAK